MSPGNRKKKVTEGLVRCVAGLVRKDDNAFVKEAGTRVQRAAEKQFLRDGNNRSGLKVCHSERSEESAVPAADQRTRFLAALGMTSLPSNDKSSI
jgi:hypothetical protein